jgi:hypothetical protein
VWGEAPHHTPEQSSIDCIAEQKVGIDRENQKASAHFFLVNLVEKAPGTDPYQQYEKQAALDHSNFLMGVHQTHIP